MDIAAAKEKLRSQSGPVMPADGFLSRLFFQILAHGVQADAQAMGLKRQALEVPAGLDALGNAAA